MKRIFIGGMVTLVFTAATAFGADAVAIFPVKDIHAGMKGVAYSVFEGTEPEAVPVDFVGVLKNAWGPRQDIILAKVRGRFEKTGVAAGMSGSPVYIDGKWVGAISLRIGVFPNDALAGITPAEYMMEIAETDTSQPVNALAPLIEPPTQKSSLVATGNVSGPGDTAPASERMMAALSGLLPPALRAAPPANNFATPIETPLTFGGFARPVLDFFAPLFDRIGVVAVQGGSDPDAGAMASPEELKSALPPGSAISGMLASGDLSLAGTGTVSYNDGRRVLAFGHPFFGLGPVEMPMTKAEIITTLGSSFSPFKIANSTQVVGSLVQDRHSGIMGVLGKQARMIPVTVAVHGEGQSHTYHYQVFENQQWTPLIMMIAFFNTLFQSNVVSAHTSFKLNGAIHINGFPDLELQTMSATPPESALPAGFMVSTWLSQRFAQIFSNRFEKPDVSSVNLDVELIPELRSAAIENVWSGTGEVHPGDEVPVKITLRPYRGEKITKDATVKIPGSAAKGTLRLLFSDAETASQQSQERMAMQQNRVGDLRDMIQNLNREKSNEEVYVTLLAPAPSALYSDKLLPSIPSTIANVMDSARAANRLTLVNETAIGQFSIPLDMVVTGGQSLNLTVN